MTKKHNPAVLSGIVDSLLNISVLLPRQMVQINSIAKGLGLPSSAIQLLLLLNDGSLGVGEISERMNIAKPNVTPLIDTLQFHNLVKRIRQTDDRRVVKVMLLEDGSAMISELKTILAASLNNSCSHLSATEMKDLNNALQTMLRLLPLNQSA